MIRAFAFAFATRILHDEGEASFRPGCCPGTESVFSIRGALQHNWKGSRAFREKDVSGEFDTIAHRHHLLQLFNRWSSGSLLSGGGSLLRRSCRKCADAEKNKDKKKQLKSFHQGPR